MSKTALAATAVPVKAAATTRRAKTSGSVLLRTTPSVTVHRPRGLRPRVAIRKKTVVDYQPSWLLVVIPALLALRSRRKSKATRTTTPTPVTQSSSTPTSPAAVTTPAARPARRRPTQVVIVSMRRLRRRPGQPVDLSATAASRPGGITSTGTVPAGAAGAAGVGTPAGSSGLGDGVSTPR